MKIYHIYARNYNFGDHALGLATRNLIREYFYDQIIFNTIDTHEYWINKHEIDRLNSDGDLVLVGGGGLIHTFALNGRAWMFHLPTCLIDKLCTPLVIFAVGFNQFRDESMQLHPGVVENLRRIQLQALSFSVRNDRSGEMLEKNGIIPDVIPDPGFFLDDDYPIPDDVDRPYAILQLAYDCKKSRGIGTEQFIENMVQVVDYITNSGYSVVIAPHCKPDNEISRVVQSRAMLRSRVIIWNYYTSISDDLIRYSLGYYKHAEFVVGMRGHAQIIPWGMGIPFVTIANHRKHIDLLKDTIMSKYIVDIRDLSAKCIIEKIELLSKNRNSLADYLRGSTQEMRYQMEKYIKEMRVKYENTPRKRSCSYYRIGRRLRAMSAEMMRKTIYK